MFKSVKRDLNIAFVFIISVFSFLLLPLIVVRQKLWLKYLMCRQLFCLFCDSKVNHCCLNISVIRICVDSWNASIASYRKITLVLHCLYLVPKSMPLFSAAYLLFSAAYLPLVLFLHRETLICGDFFWGEKSNQRQTKLQNLICLLWSWRIKISRISMHILVYLTDIFKDSLCLRKTKLCSCNT